MRNEIQQKLVFSSLQFFIRSNCQNNCWIFVNTERDTETLRTNIQESKGKKKTGRSTLYSTYPCFFIVHSFFFIFLPQRIVSHSSRLVLKKRSIKPKTQKNRKKNQKERWNKMHKTIRNKILSICRFFRLLRSPVRWKKAKCYFRTTQCHMQCVSAEMKIKINCK